MSKLILIIFTTLSFCSLSQIQQFDPIIDVICDSVIKLHDSGEEPNTNDYNWLIRSVKNQHIELWGEALMNYTQEYHGNSFIFDQYFYHCLLRSCPVFLKSEMSNLYFYAADEVNEKRYNDIQKFILEMELDDSINISEHSFLDSLASRQKDSLRIISAQYIKSIGQNCYLDTKRQINRENQTYIRITFIDFRTRQNKYELLFYYLGNDSVHTNFVVFKSKEMLDKEEAIRKERINNIPPPPPMPKKGDK